MACGVMAREPTRRVGAEASSARQKRARDGFDGKTSAREGSAAGEVSAVFSAPAGQRRLQERMKAELEAVRDLHRKALLLCRGAGRGGAAPTAKRDAPFSAAGSRREAPSEAVAKRRKMEVAHKTKEPEKLKQQAPVQRAAAPPLPERKVEKSKELERRLRMEEIARAREKCRQEVLEVEMTALADETIYRRDLEELGIAEFEYVVTRTRSHALSQDLGRSSLVLVGL